MEVKVSWPVLEVGVGETRLSGVALLVPGVDEQAIDAATASRVTTKAATHQPVLATTARKTSYFRIGSLVVHHVTRFLRMTLKVGRIRLFSLDKPRHLSWVGCSCSRSLPWVVF